MRTTRLSSLVGLSFALVVPCVPWSRWLDEFADTAHLVAHELVWWAMVAVLLLFVRCIERRPWSSIGWRRATRRELAEGIAVGLLIVVCLAGLWLVVLPWLGWQEDEPVARLLATPGWWRAVSVLRAAVAEEVLFRGYACERGAELLRSRAVAAWLSWAVFTVAHLSVWGLGHLLIAGTGGALLTLLWLRHRSLVANILAHTIVDGIAMLA